jgi:hypothetical protein
VGVAAGASSSTFTVNTKPVAVDETVTIKAASGGTIWPATLTLVAPKVSKVAIASTRTTYDTIAGTVSLTSQAPSSGIPVTLTSSDPKNASVPASVNIAGTTGSSFVLTFQPVSVSETVTIRAAYNGSSSSTTILLAPPSLVSLRLNLNAVTGAERVGGQVGLSGVAPAGGTAVTLASSDPTNLSVPSQAVVPAGTSATTFVFTTKLVAKSETVIITASRNGVTETATVTLSPP